MNYYLIGLPGCGKSTLGKKLARHLGCFYVDMDKEIEKQEGLKVKDIFALQGEDYFRKAEQSVLKELSQGDNQIIATGGGAPCFFDNMEVIVNTGTSIFLDVPREWIVDRMMEKQSRLDKRPLIKSTNREDLLKEINDKYEERLPYYSKANIRISKENIQIEDIIKALN